MTRADRLLHRADELEASIASIDQMWDNQARPQGAGNTSRPLTRPPDYAGRGLAMKATRVCSVEGCERPSCKRGWCDKHYKRWRAHGDPNIVLVPATAPSETCSIDGCVGKYYGRGYCKLHYCRWRRTGDPLRVLNPPPVEKCKIEDCANPGPFRHSMCIMHYTRWKRYGDPLTVWFLSKAPVGAVCSIEGCGGGYYARGYCQKHYERWSRLGDAGAPVKDMSGNAPWCSYQAAHDRVRSARGPASDHSCVDCGGLAEDWSYSHRGEQELIARLSNSKGHTFDAPYSSNPDDYEARCRSCHIRFDRRDGAGLRDIGAGTFRHSHTLNPEPTEETA